MSMLAERRRKQIISIDPQNQHWAKDESKFGKKLMQKMGWSEGKGLGSNEHGIRDAIKLNPNSNQKGLGHARRSDETWLEHQDDFQAILESLNKDKCDNSEDTDTKASKPSLETISKKSRARVHYHKFARSKDLSAQTAEDIAQVLGSRKRKHKEDVKKPDEPKIEQPIDSKIADTDSSTEKSDNLSVSTVSTADYFANKMAALKKKQKL